MTSLDRVAQRSMPSLTVLQGVLVVLSAGVVFSFGGLAFRLTNDITAWQYLVFRGVGAVLTAIVILVLLYRSQVADVVRSVEPSHVLAGVCLGTISAVFIVALEFVSVAFVLFLQTLAPISAAYFSWWLMRERVSRAAILATAVSVVGVVIMVSGTLTESIRPAGLIALAIPLGFGLYATLIRRAARIEPLVPVVVGGLVLAIVASIVVMASTGFTQSLGDTMIGMFAGSALLALPLSVFNIGQRVVPAPETALLLMSEVVLAPVWVWIFVSEQPAATTLIGGLVILAAVVGLTLYRRTRAVAG